MIWYSYEGYDDTIYRDDSQSSDIIVRYSDFVMDMLSSIGAPNQFIYGTPRTSWGTFMQQLKLNDNLSDIAWLPDTIK